MSLIAVASVLVTPLFRARLNRQFLLGARNQSFLTEYVVGMETVKSQPMLRLAGLWQEFQQANIAMMRLGDIMDAPAEPYALTPSRTAEGRAEIRLNDLSFRYSPEHPYLYRNLNLVLKPGKLTVLAGPSGCGKSTLAKLLLGFYQPSDGQISIDGRDIRNFSANELRQYYGVVPQETYLFAGPIYENLIAASPHAGFSQIVEACKIEIGDRPRFPP